MDEQPDPDRRSPKPAPWVPPSIAARAIDAAKAETPPTEPPPERPPVPPAEESPTDERARKRPLNETLLHLAGAASAAAGLGHAAAAGSHAGLEPLATIFAITAVVQVGIGVLTVTHAGRRAAWASIVLNGGFVAAWVLSRTVGLSFLEAGVQGVGTQDLLCALLGGLAVVAAGAAMAPGVRTRRIAPVMGALAATALVLLAVPGMAAEHTHGAGDHDHDAEAASGSAGHDMTHDMTHESGSHDTTTGTAAHDHLSTPARLDHDPTEEQKAAAHQLIDQTKAATAKYASVEAAKAAGYRSIGDSRTGFEHFINAEYQVNKTILDPNQPESLVYRVEPDGSRTFVTVMYVMPPGSTMDDVPDVAGNVTMWHQHDNLCFNPSTGKISGIFRNGRCLPSGVQDGNVPMLHVWVTPNDCGPFAGVDEGGMTGSCVKNF